MRRQMIVVDGSLSWASNNFLHLTLVQSNLLIARETLRDICKLLSFISTTAFIYQALTMGTSNANDTILTFFWKSLTKSTKEINQFAYNEKCGHNIFQSYLATLLEIVRHLKQLSNFVEFVIYGLNSKWIGSPCTI